MSKPSLPQGTRDFNASIIRKRNYIFSTIQSVFELYGFEPLETPAMENLETLMGKYGDEGDKLIFKILNNGLDNPTKHEKAISDFLNVLKGKNTIGITERALRYDLTIPFARYVAMNYGQLSFPFKRYQIQPVWRADRPQRGRYREFYQCDADVVGSNSLMNEVDLTNIYSTVFNKLKIEVEIKINSRKILQALAEQCGGADKLVDITVAIDKLDKIGIEKVKDELHQRGLQEKQINTIENYLQINGSNNEKLQAIKALLSDNAAGEQGIKEIEHILNYETDTAKNLVVDFTLARGLNYYTGIIFEVKAIAVQMGSIGGGGRYDDLTSLFGVPNISGVGISFGVDRIFDVMEELNVFPPKLNSVATSNILFFNLGEAEAKQAYVMAQTLRSHNISCEVFTETSKFDKQFKYAEKKQIPFVAIIGSKELEEGIVNIKNLNTRQEYKVNISTIAEEVEKIIQEL